MTKTGRVAKLHGQHAAPFCEIHPDDAAPRAAYRRRRRRGVVSGERGETQVRATVTKAIRAGVVFLPMHWGRLVAGERGRTTNLTSPRTDPVSKEPDLKFAAVEARRHRPAPRRIVIVGGGATAFGFIEAHAAAGLADDIIMLGDEPQPIYNRVLLPHYISGTSGWSELVKGTVDELAKRRVRFQPAGRVASIARPQGQGGDGRGRRPPSVRSPGARHRQPRGPALPGTAAQGRGVLPAQARRRRGHPRRGRAGPPRAVHRRRGAGHRARRRAARAALRGSPCCNAATV